MKNQTNSPHSLHRDGSEAQQYFKSIASGEVVACDKIKKLANIMLPRFGKGYREWHYDPKKALRPVEFIERFCKVPHGRAGVAFELTDYELAIVETAFGFVDEQDLREFRDVMVVIGRKNGKTSLAAALSLYMLMADGEFAPQCYCIATSKDQASLAYGSLLNMVRQSPALEKHLHKGVVPARHQDGMMFPKGAGYFTPLSSQTRNLDGLNAHFAIVDEMAAVINRDVYDLVRQSTGSRDEPMILTITTNGFERGGLFDDQYTYAERWLDGSIDDDSFLPFVWELDDRTEWTDESMWLKANPGLGTVKKKTYVEQQVRKAKNDPSYLPTVLTKEFNVPENKASAWLRYEEAVNTTTFNLEEMGFKYCVVGYDASDSVDLTAAQAFMMKPNDEHLYELSMYWLPEAALEATRKSGKRIERDHVPYEKWVSNGLLRLVPGNKIDHRVVFQWIQELAEDFGIYTLALAYDPWHLTDDTWTNQARMTVGEGNAEPVRFGAKTLSSPMKSLKADYAAKRIVDNHHPINEWCRMNVSVAIDRNDNWQPVKGKGPGGRIDGFAAEICAYIALERHKDSYLGLIG